MSGRDKTAETQSRAIADKQFALMKEQTDAANQRAAKMDSFQQPMVDFYKGLQSSDPTTRLIAGSIPLGNITQSQRAAEGNIFESVPEGPARDFALSQAKRQGAGEKASTLNDLFLKSLSGLAGIGSEQGQFGLQQLGAGARFGEASAAGNQALSQQAVQRKSATLGAVGQLAGIAGGLATGGMFGGGASGGGSKSWNAMAAMPKQVQSFASASQYLPGPTNSGFMGW